jgi:hypothetical protein
MTGAAKAVFICGAINTGPCSFCGREDCPVRRKVCGKEITVDLQNDGYYTIFNVPESWHIQLGYFDDSEATIVRCPQHCTWVMTGDDGIRTAGQWEDAP